MEGGAPALHTIVLPLLLGVALSPVAIWLRADLARSAVNRRIFAIIYLVFVASSILRGLAYLYQTDINQMMTFELIIIATATATLGVSFRRDFLWVAGGSVLCAFGTQRFAQWLEFFYVPPFVGLILVSTRAKAEKTLPSSVDTPK
jgi:hypothetical protein